MTFSGSMIFVRSPGQARHLQLYGSLCYIRTHVGLGAGPSNIVVLLSQVRSLPSFFLEAHPTNKPRVYGCPTPITNVHWIGLDPPALMEGPLLR